MEILVQDDASPDCDARELITPPEPVLVERNERNLGFAGNCNAGAKRAKGDVLLFLNQDTRAHEGWFYPLMAMFDDPKVGIVGPKLVVIRFGMPDNPKDRPYLFGQSGFSIQSCGGLYDGGRGPYHRYIGWAADDWRVNQTERVSWTTGAALAVRRDLFVKVGGFDEGYKPGYFEDVDLCEKVKAAGLEVWYCPQAVFEHNVGSTGGIPSEQFRANSIRFHRLWDEKVKPDTPVIHVNY